MMQFAAWYERFPGRVETERSAYREAGLDFRLNEDILAQRGVVVFEGTASAAGQQYPLRVVYPSGFPYVRPEVVAADASLPRHQSPFAKNLCLLPNEQAAWRESDAPEPASVWYPYSQGTSFLLLEQPPATGPAQFGEFRFTLAANARPALQAILTEMQFASKTKGAELPRPWKLPQSLLPPFIGETFSGSWIRCDAPPPYLKTVDGGPAGHGEYLKWALAKERNLSIRLATQAKKQNGVKAFALVYPDEGPQRGQYHDNWLVGIEATGLPQPQLLRPFAWTQDEFFRRQPSLRGLERKKVLIVGLGALGATLAAQLARAGVGQLGVADHDFVDAGPLVRQDFDVSDVGYPKTEAVAWRARRINPGVAVETFPSMLGAADVELSGVADGKDRLVAFAEAVRGYDLLISATGDTSVDRILNEIGAAAAVPCLFAWVLNGAWGGRVFRAQPGRACYECLAHSWERFGRPSEDPSEVSLYGRGCGFPTFTGTGFDAVAAAGLAARLAVQTLLAGQPAAYPDSPFNLINWSSRGATTEELPLIEQFDVPRQEGCRTCRMYER